MDTCRFEEANKLLSVDNDAVSFHQRDDGGVVGYFMEETNVKTPEKKKTSLGESSANPIEKNYHSFNFVLTVQQPTLNTKYKALI